MARKPKRNQEAYTRLSFLPKQKELNNTNTEQDYSVTCDTRVGSRTWEIREERATKLIVEWLGARRS